MGFVTNWWDTYESFASAGGPFRWIWTLLIGITVALFVLIQIGRFLRFCGRAFATGFRAELQEARSGAAGESRVIADAPQLDREQ